MTNTYDRPERRRPGGERGDPLAGRAGISIVGTRRCGSAVARPAPCAAWWERPGGWTGSTTCVPRGNTQWARNARALPARSNSGHAGGEPRCLTEVPTR